MKKDIKTINEEIAAIQDTLYVISGKWKFLILIAIYNDIFRFREIQRNVPKITSKVLTKELRELEQNQLITRTVYDLSPVTVEYKLTDYARSLEPMIVEMINWGRNHRKKISGK